ncbi:unnamed protein product [Rotaria magnacalcarata]|uniref:CLIC N-terminal domain-containing protein n=1 Tax=Rotaria magnacalcarata TaxID=392030 RepID=A0A817ALU0_9BILA|nr:unnamed protein product [Rotaria magnacalcarata]
MAEEVEEEHFDPRTLLNDEDDQKLHLFIKAGTDGRSKGACPFCQDVFLKLLIKREADNEFCFDVITINYYLDSSYPSYKLSFDDPEALKIQSNVFKRFTYLIKDVHTDSQTLLYELEKIDKFLRERGTKYISANRITGLDCSLWPKLQHIRVAANYILNLSIPVEFSALWNYLASAYELDAFVKSCPSDQEIVLHWIRRESSKEYLQLKKEEPRFSFEIPNRR